MRFSGSRHWRHRHAALALAGMLARQSLRGHSSEAASIVENLAVVRGKMDAAVASRLATGASRRDVRLVAVSKTKPVEALLEAYQAGHRHFGENYVQELLEKVPQMPEDVQWHFIGRLQSNKVNALIKGCPNLSCLETVSSEKLAKAVNKAWKENNPGKKLRVMVQINSSGESSKGGVAAQESVELCRFIHTQCEALEIAGLMTIGAPDYSGCRTEDFELLHTTCREVAELLGLTTEDLELSMGMSNDFETAIIEGSTSVRVGSVIFGAREYPAKA
mmetsp:Transcript_65389/g.156350  ORF Transcript_65389/g.156350 Transcript_65389/m.156350 type:complete len:276 (-) Transcript_65389:18-845(-)